jgi:hypothetical protein
VIRRFNRFELKYIVDTRLRDAICADLALNMRPDEHGASGSYRVTSLYYDSPDVTCFWSKIDGIKYRRKVRVRTYGSHVDDVHNDVMVEIKQRINRTVQKRRLSLPLEQAYVLCEGHGHEEISDPTDRVVASEVAFLAHRLQLRPACVITYLRQAWVGSVYEPGLRVTFDDELACRGPERGLGPGLPNHFFMPPGLAIMEVKVDETVPLWVVRTLAKHQCSLRRISKYCVGLQKLRSLDRTYERLSGHEPACGENYG